MHMHKLDKKELLYILEQNGDLPFKSEVIQHTFSSIPKSLQKGLAWKMYLKYFYEGEIIAMEYINPPHGRNLFTSINSIVTFMKSTSFPDATHGYIRDVMSGKRDHYYHFKFYTISREEV